MVGGTNDIMNYIIFVVVVVVVGGGGGGGGYLELQYSIVSIVVLH